MSNVPISDFFKQPFYEEMFRSLNNFKQLAFRFGIIHESLDVSGVVHPSEFVSDFRGGLPILFINAKNAFYIACKPLRGTKYLLLDDSFFGVSVKDTGFALVVATYLVDVDTESSINMDIVHKIYHAFVYFKARYGHNFSKELNTAFRLAVFNGSSSGFVQMIRQYLDWCEEEPPVLTQVEVVKDPAVRDLSKEYDVIIKRADELRQLMSTPEKATSRKRSKAGPDDV